MWPFWLADVLLLGLAFRIDSLGHRPLLWSEALLLVLCGAGAAGGLIFPFLRRHNDEHALNQAQLLAQATSQIQNLDHVAALVTGATNQWREYQEQASQTAVTAKGVAESMAAEAKSFTEFIQRANDIEKAHLRLEVEKLRRAEAEWLQILVHILDHIFLLFQAARRSSQPGLAEQIGHFQNSCRDAARRVGLVPTMAEAGAPFDPKLHQVPDSVTPGENAVIADTLATGYTYQGQLIRLPRSFCRAGRGSLKNPSRLHRHELAWRSLRVFLQRLLNGSYREKQFKLVGRQRNKAKLLVVELGFLIFGIHEKANAARRVENLDKLPHGRNEQSLTDALTLICFGDRQPAQPDAGHVAGQLPGFFRRKRLRFQLAEIE